MRTLPWLKGAAPTAPGSERPAKRKRSEGAAENEQVVTNHATRLRRPARTPSTSPPPAPRPEEYMQDGFDQDDIYMMVEDEFLSTAQQFTQHLHHAEYVRLKNLARAEKASMIQSIAPPVHDRAEPSAETKIVQQAAGLAGTKGKSSKSTRPVDLCEEEEDDQEETPDPWMRNGHLAGLMTTTRKSQVLSTKEAQTSPNTRAKAGFTKMRDASPIRVQPILSSATAATVPGKMSAAESSEDDLDMPATKRSWAPKALDRASKEERPRSPRPLQPITRRKADSISQNPETRHEQAVFPKPSGASSRILSNSRATATIAASTTAPSFSPLNTTRYTSTAAAQPSLAGALLPKSTISAEAAARLARRKAERTRMETEKTERTVKTQEIPTFLV